MKIRKFRTGVINTNTYVAYEGLDGVIIDPAYDVAAAESIKGFAKAEGIVLRAILLTHGHFDHCGGCGLFENLPAFISEADAERAKRAEFYGKAFGNFTALNALTCKPFGTNAEFVDAGGFRFKVIHTPGHSSGSVCYLHKNIIFCGDTLFKYCIGRTDFPEGSDEDMTSSLIKLIALEGDFKLFPGHGESTTLDFEKKHNGYLLKL